MNPKLELADTFIDRLIEAGIVPGDTNHVIIDAQYGRITTLHYTRYVLDSEILQALAPMKAELRESD